MTTVAMRSSGRGVGSDSAALDNELCRFNLDGGRKIQRCLNILVDDAGNMVSAGYIASPAFYGIVFDTNVAAAGLTMSGTTLAADGTDANIDINITPKGTGTATVTGSIKMIDGNQTAGYVMTCDANGVGTWQVAADPDFSDGGEAGGADRTIGNTDNYDLGFVTNNVNRLQIQNDGNIGVNVADPCSLVEIWDDDAHPVFSITAAHDTDYDPQIQFRTDATDTVKASLGVDASDDSLRINMGSGVGGASHFIMDANGGFKFQNSTDSTTAYQWLDADGGTPILNIDTTNERVGIGTAAPSWPLHIAKNTDGGQIQLAIENSFTNIAASTDERVAIEGIFGGWTGSYIVTGKEDDFTDAAKRKSYMGLWTRTSTTGMTEKVRITSGGNIGIGETAPETLFEMTSTSPIFTIHNSEEEDADGGRESIIQAFGEQSGGEETTLVKMTMAHDGALDDEKGYLSIACNHGSDGDAPTEVLKLGYGGVKTMKADPYLNSDTNFFLGVDAGGAGNLTGSYNSILGNEAGYSLTSGGNNIAFGYKALRDCTEGVRNVAFGAEALTNNTEGNYNVAIGASSMFDNTTGADNVAVGYEALQNNITGTYNVAFGSSGLDGNTEGQRNVGIGWRTGRYNQTGDYNTMVGVLAGSAGNGSYSNNTFIGYASGLYTTGSNNINIGYKAALNSTTGSNNLLLGYQAADNLTTGDNNIIIGYDIDAQSATADGQLSIGNLIFGTGIDGTGTTVSSGNVGIGESAPETLVEMTSTAPYFTSHNSTEENIEGGRECIWRAKGEKQDGTEHTLGQMQFSHDGTGDDYKADFILSVNQNGGADTLVEALRIDSAGACDIVGDFTAGTIQADNGFTGSFTNGDGDTVTVVGGIMTDIS